MFAHCVLRIETTDSFFLSSYTLHNNAHSLWYLSNFHYYKNASLRSIKQCSSFFKFFIIVGSVRIRLTTSFPFPIKTSIQIYRLWTFHYSYWQSTTIDPTRQIIHYGLTKGKKGRSFVSPMFWSHSYSRNFQFSCWTPHVLSKCTDFWVHQYNARMSTKFVLYNMEWRKCQLFILQPLNTYHQLRLTVVIGPRPVNQWYQYFSLYAHMGKSTMDENWNSSLCDVIAGL